MLTLRIFMLGYIWEVNLNDVAKLLASSRTIKTSVEDAIRNIGEPEIHGVGYSYDRLFGLYPTSRNETIRVGITTAPIQDNFFANNNGRDAILVTLFQADEFCEKSGRTKEEYLAHTILCQLLWIQYKSRNPSADYSDLFHEDTRGCIFDFCYNKTDIAIGLRVCQIDPICKGKLVEGNIPETLVNDAERILKRMRTPTFMKSIQVSIQNPIFSFLLGGLILGLAVNVFSSLALGEFNTKSDYFVALFLLFLAIAMVVGNYIKILVSSKNKSA